MTTKFDMVAERAYEPDLRELQWRPKTNYEPNSTKRLGPSNGHVRQERDLRQEARSNYQLRQARKHMNVYDKIYQNMNNLYRISQIISPVCLNPGHVTLLSLVFDAALIECLFMNTVLDKVCPLISFNQVQLISI